MSSKTIILFTGSHAIGNTFHLREGSFFIGGGGLGLQRGGSLVNFLQIVEGQICFIRNRGRVPVFFGMEEKLLHVA